MNLTKWTCQDCLIRFRPAGPAQLNRPADLCTKCGRRMWNADSSFEAGSKIICYTVFPNDDVEELA